MVHYYWDFESGKLSKLDPMVRIELVKRLQQLGIPVSSHIAGFDKPYIEIDSNDPIQNHPCWKDGMIPRPVTITRVAVRHLTYQDEDFVNKVEETGNDYLTEEMKKLEVKN